MADRIAIMNFARLQQIGRPKEVYDRPQNEFVAGFIGEPPMNIADCHLVRAEGKVTAVSSSFKVTLGSQEATKLESYQGSPQVRLGVRPESIKVRTSPSEGSVKAAVYMMEPQGERTILSARLGGGEVFLIEVAPEFEAELEDTVHLEFREPIHIFEKVDGVNLTC